MAERVIVLGAGGHAAVLADALLAAGVEVAGFTDANPALHGSRVLGIPVVGGDDTLDRYNPAEIMLANGIGGVSSTEPRRQAQEQLERKGWRFRSVIHPGALVSPFAELEQAVQILSGAIVQPRARIGKGTIVNTGSIVEHDCVISIWTHVAPGAVVCGRVSIGSFSHIGARAVVRQNVRLGARTVVGAGAVVVSDFGGEGVLIGVPARRWERQ